MKVGISVKLDVTKIDKARLFKGEKGTYLDLTTFVDLDQKDEYDNNGFVTQSPTKEERDSKTQLPILGNVKVFYKDQGSQPQQQPATQQPGIANDDWDDIPFAPFEKGSY